MLPGIPFFLESYGINGQCVVLYASSPRFTVSSERAHLDLVVASGDNLN